MDIKPGRSVLAEGLVLQLLLAELLAQAALLDGLGIPSRLIFEEIRQAKDGGFRLLAHKF
jgi:hypothetical protein